MIRTQPLSVLKIFLLYLTVGLRYFDFGSTILLGPQQKTTHPINENIQGHDYYQNSDHFDRTGVIQVKLMPTLGAIHKRRNIKGGGGPIIKDITGRPVI